MQVDDRSVFVNEGGAGFDASRPAVVVLVHGAGMDHSAWAWQIRALGQRDYSVLALDLPGHGRSAGPPLSSIEAGSDWLVRFLDAAAIERAALAGHSMGALIALDVAARHPKRVRALALVCAAARMPVHPALLRAALDNPAAAIAMIKLWGQGQRHDDAQPGGGPAEDGVTTGLWQRLLERSAPGVLFAGLKSCDDYRCGAARAAAVGCPTVVIAGEHDRMTPLKTARELAALIPGAILTVIPAAGHMLMIDRPALTLDALQTTL